MISSRSVILGKRSNLIYLFVLKGIEEQAIWHSRVSMLLLHHKSKLCNILFCNIYEKESICYIHVSCSSVLYTTKGNMVYKFILFYIIYETRGNFAHRLVL